jgi:hypothetical protein
LALQLEPFAGRDWNSAINGSVLPAKCWGVHAKAHGRALARVLHLGAMTAIVLANHPGKAKPVCHSKAAALDARWTAIPGTFFNVARRNFILSLRTPETTMQTGYRGFLTWPEEEDAAYHDTYYGVDQGQHIGHGMGRVAISPHGNTNSSAHYQWTVASQIPAGAVVVGMVDGHVEISKLPNLWTYTWRVNWGSSMNVLIGTPN